MKENTGLNFSNFTSAQVGEFHIHRIHDYVRNLGLSAGVVLGGIYLTNLKGWFSVVVGCAVCVAGFLLYFANCIWVATVFNNARTNRVRRAQTKREKFVAFCLLLISLLLITFISMGTLTLFVQNLVGRFS